MANVRLYTGQPGTSSAAVATATKTTVIFHAAVCNPTASTAWLSVWVVPSGDTAADDTIIYHEIDISANSQVALELLPNVTLGAGDALHMQAETAAALTVHIFGDQ